MNTHLCTIRGIGQKELLPCVDGTPLPNGKNFSLNCPVECEGKWGQWSQCGLLQNAPDLKAQGKTYCTKSRTYVRTNSYKSIDPNIIWKPETCEAEEGAEETKECTLSDPTFNNCEILYQCYHPTYYAADDGGKTYIFRKSGVTLINDTGEDFGGFVKVEWSGEKTTSSYFPYRHQRNMKQQQITLTSTLDCSLGEQSYLEIRNTNPYRVLFRLDNNDLRKLYDFAYKRAYGWPNVTFYVTGAKTLKMKMDNSWKKTYNADQQWCTFFHENVV